MSDSTQAPSLDRVELAADLVSAYVSNNSLPAADLPSLIAQVHAALATLSAPTAPTEESVERATPGQIKKSITPDALISFIDGKPYKTLKRHLSTHGMDFETYRAKYGLPADYPTVSAKYSQARSALAKHLGLGQQRRKPAQKAAEPAETVAEAPKAKAPRKTGGRKKAAEAA